MSNSTTPQGDQQSTLFAPAENVAAEAIEKSKVAPPQLSSAVAMAPTDTPQKHTTRKARSIKIIATKKSALEEMYRTLVDGVKSYFQTHNFKRAVLGVSGGVDSSLTLKIAVDALGAQNVTGIIMPELGLTNPENIEHAKVLCQFLGAHWYYQPINTFLTDFTITPWKPTPRAQMNTKARVRMLLLYNFANTENALVLGTSNLSETLLGYGTKYGDMAADIEVIGDLYKTQVVELAEYAGLPPEIVFKTPSAELSPGQTDEKDLGARYVDMDQVLMRLELGADECIAHGLPPALVHLVFRRVEEHKHKRELTPVIMINKRIFEKHAM